MSKQPRKPNHRRPHGKRRPHKRAAAAAAVGTRPSPHEKWASIPEIAASATVTQLIAAVERGFPYQLLHALSDSTGLSIETIADVARIPARTLSRRKASGRLEPDESERLLRLSNLVDKATALFESDRQAAIEWLCRPQKALGDGVPLQYAKSEIGARAVEDLIGRLEHGIFT
jgi:putative toxin-antitoxin system antitoxin component (TIGR02293 family)